MKSGIKLLLTCFFLLSTIKSFSIETEQIDTLNIGYYQSPPFVYSNADGKLSGISIWLWEAITEDLNIPFQMTYIPLPEVLDKLEDGTIDMCLNPLTVTSDRIKQVKFSYPFYVSNSSAALKQVSGFKKGIIFIRSFFSINFFSAVFALFLIILVFGILVWIFERKRNSDEFSPEPHGIMSGIWWSAVTMTTVGYGDKSPQTFWGRTIALIWMFTAVIILSSFTASIASSLTVNHLQWDKNSVLDFKDTPVGVIDGSATESWMRKRFFTKIKTFETIPEGLEAIKKNKIRAFMHDEPILRFHLKKTEHIDDLEVISAKFNLQFYSFGFSDKLNENTRDEIILALSQISESSDWEMLLAEYNLTLQ